MEVIFYLRGKRGTPRIWAMINHSWQIFMVGVKKCFTLIITGTLPWPVAPCLRISFSMSAKISGTILWIIWVWAQSMLIRRLESSFLQSSTFMFPSIVLSIMSLTSSRSDAMEAFSRLRAEAPWRGNNVLVSRGLSQQFWDWKSWTTVWDRRRLA